MRVELSDTIAALASPPGAAARGIVRLSGPEVLAFVDRVFQPEAFPATDQAKSRSVQERADCGGLRGRGPRVLRGQVQLGPDRLSLRALLYLWPSRRSYTGAPLVELHTLGSPPLLEMLLRRLFEAGARPARPGEFTLRAFLVGKLDLAQAEAVLGVIDANDARALETALNQLAGGLSRQIVAMRSELLNLLADLEAGLDFVDEDIEFVTAEQVEQRLRSAIEEIEALLLHAEARAIPGARRSVVLAGLPNAGKSTLFNALLERSAAIVSPVSGTTRDWLRGEAAWNGVEIELIDTAGWENAEAPIAREAQASRREAMESADLVVWCVPSDADATALETNQRSESLARSEIAGTRFLNVRTKADIAMAAVLCEGIDAAIPVSAARGEGLERLRTAIMERVTGAEALLRPLVGSTAARGRHSLGSARAALMAALEASQRGAGAELIALDLRSAHEHLGEIVGAVYTDDLLDRIFSRFCIGK